MICCYVAWQEENRVLPEEKRLLPEERKTSLHKSLSLPASQSILVQNVATSAKLQGVLHCSPSSSWYTDVWMYLEFYVSIARHYYQISEWLDNKARRLWINPASSIIGLRTICVSSVRPIRLHVERSPGGLVTKHRSCCDTGKRKREVYGDHTIVGKYSGISEEEHDVVDVSPFIFLTASILA